MNSLRRGFTIVELLIVIVVIAILAAISVVAYNGIQARANDSRMKDAAAQVEKALMLYSVDYGSVIYGGLNSTAVTAGQPCNNGQDGWLGKGSYACTAEDTLVSLKLLPEGFIGSLPANPVYPSNGGRTTLMLYKCGSQQGRYSLFWALRSPSQQDTDSINNVLSQCGYSNSIRDTWGMRAGKIIQL